MSIKTNIVACSLHSLKEQVLPSHDVNCILCKCSMLLLHNTVFQSVYFVSVLFTMSLLYKYNMHAFHSPRGGVHPNIRHIRMCHPKGYGFWAFLVWKRVYTLHILVWHRVWFSRELREHMNVVIILIPNELERNRNMRIRNSFEEFFCLRSNLRKLK